MKVGDLVIYCWDDLRDDDVRLCLVDSIDGKWVHLLGDDPDTFTTVDRLEVINESR